MHYLDLSEYDPLELLLIALKSAVKMDRIESHAAYGKPFLYIPMKCNLGIYLCSHTFVGSGSGRTDGDLPQHDGAEQSTDCGHRSPLLLCLRSSRCHSHTGQASLDATQTHL